MCSSLLCGQGQLSCLCTSVIVIASNLHTWWAGRFPCNFATTNGAEKGPQSFARTYSPGMQMHACFWSAAHVLCRRYAAIYSHAARCMHGSSQAKPSALQFSQMMRMLRAKGCYEIEEGEGRPCMVIRADHPGSQGWLACGLALLLVCCWGRQATDLIGSILG